MKSQISVRRILKNIIKNVFKFQMHVSSGQVPQNLYANTAGGMLLVWSVSF